MIQLRPTIALKIEKLSLDGICFRISLWILFYFTILIMTFNGRSRYNSQNIAKFNCQAQDDTYLCDMCYVFTKPVQEFDLTMITQVDKNIVYEKYHNKTIQANLRDFSHLFPNMQYKLIGKSTENKGNQDFLNCSLDDKNYETEIANLDNSLSLTCLENKQSHMLQCQGYIDEIESHDYMNFHFRIIISGKNYTELFTEHKQSFNLEYQNPLYYSFRTNFQIVFLFLIIYAIYYLHSNLSDYPRQNWLKIHLWMQYLLITMFLYNLPIHLLREYSISLVHMFSNLFELLIQNSLFYFWLDMFELQLKEEESEKKILTPWNIQKFLLVACYTSPQVILDFYIFLQKEINQQYDPLKEIHFYEEFKQFEIGCLIAYSIMYFYLLYKSFQQKKTLPPQQDKEKDIRQHDPFVEGQEIKQEEEQIHSYKALHLLSLISFIALIYYQRNRILDPHSLTAQSTINEEALLNIYLCMIIQLYMPFQEAYEEDKNKNVYGDIELEEQGRFYCIFIIVKWIEISCGKIYKNRQINKLIVITVMRNYDFIQQQQQQQQQQYMQLQKEIFDETFIQLNLKGGQLHTQLLQVEALVLKGKLKGQTLPLKCQWFNVTKSNDFIEIEEVSGQFYQPCIQDVDTKIMVQAIPILDQEYEGMPICKETNFLKIDQQILDQVKIAFDQNYLEVVCKLESASGNLPKTFDHIQMPQEVQITLSESLISIFISSKNIIEEFKEGELRIIKKSNNQLELGFPQCKLIVATANNIIRDVIFQFFKTIKGKSIDHSQLYATITDYKQKLQFQESELNNLNEQIKQLKQKLKDSQLLQQQQQKKIDQYDKLQQQLVNKENELQQQKANFEKLEGKTQFYQQEIKVLKSSVVTLENQSKKQQIELEEFKKIQHQNQDEIREMFYRDKLDNLRIQNEKCIKENQQWQLLNDQLLKEINVIQHSLKQQNEEKETQQNELNALRKKYESLTIEVNKQESNPISEILDNKKFNVDEEESKNEIIRLKQTIINLENTLKSMRMNYEQDMLKIVNGKAFIKQNHTQEMQLLQKLANSLAESLTDKELALQNQRNINRELLIRMQEQNK